MGEMREIVIDGIKTMVDDNYSELVVDGEMIKLISADSHVAEPPNCYIDYIDPAYRDRAPHVEKQPDGSEAYVVEGSSRPVPIGLVASAGREPQDLKTKFNTYAELRPGGWDPKARLEEQDIDGISAEVVYPTVGMLLSDTDDTDLQQASMWAYNRWLHDEFVAGAPDRLFGVGQTAMRSVSETIDDMQKIKEMGFVSVMLPCHPNTEFDYEDERFDPLWRASVELDLPISVHTFAGRKKSSNHGTGFRGTDSINRHNMVMRENQDIIGMLIFSRVFERHPELRLVCVEADAGWVPHYVYAMDRTYTRHRYWKGVANLERLPSEYFYQNVYLTWQNDATAFAFADKMNVERLLWANDHPHSDATWPNSQPMLQRHIKGLTDYQKRRILNENVRDLYHLKL